MDINYATETQQRTSGDIIYTVDGKNATFNAEIAEKRKEKTEKIYLNPARMWEEHNNILPSMSLIRFGKVKPFIDGTLAVVELELMKKGHSYSRTDFLEDVLEKTTLPAAQNYLKLALAIGGSKENQDLITLAMQDSQIGTTQGFYQWNPELENVYRQIKVLGASPELFMPLEGKKVHGHLQNIIRNDKNIKDAYERILEVFAQLTGPYRDVERLFPDVKLPDQEYFVELSLQQQDDIPAGLGNALVEAIKKGKVTFEPTPDAGLYHRQMHELTPQLLRTAREFKKWQINEEYVKTIEHEFISQWAGTRDTHVGRTDFSRQLLGCCADRGPKTIHISPEILVEPFATTYLRMSESLHFMDGVITSHFGNAIHKQKRILPNGERADMEIGEEFEFMKQLVQGMQSLSYDSIHDRYAKDCFMTGPARVAQSWLEDIQDDPDLNRNMAIFVPIIRTTNGKKQISYIDIGYTLLDLNVEYDKKPEITFDNGFAHTEFTSKKYKLPMLVHKEVRVPVKRLPNTTSIRELVGEEIITRKDFDELTKNLKKFSNI